MSISPSNKAAKWLRLLTKNPRELRPLFPGDYKELKGLIGIQPATVLRSPKGEPTIFFIRTSDAIAALKSTYRFFNKTEATKEIHDAAHSDLGGVR